MSKSKRSTVKKRNPIARVVKKIPSRVILDKRAKIIKKIKIMEKNQ